MEIPYKFSPQTHEVPGTQVASTPFGDSRRSLYFGSVHRGDDPTLEWKWPQQPHIHACTPKSRRELDIGERKFCTLFAWCEALYGAVEG